MRKELVTITAAHRQAVPRRRPSSWSGSGGVCWENVCRQNCGEAARGDVVGGLGGELAKLVCGCFTLAGETVGHVDENGVDTGSGA
ncbi:hypothetical protein ACFXKC_43765 [Streptomyces sp. NPDC059340]|uniref:hypothetical protein n=1 Tax=Streptomyces sp. NPDC059340 TaxID=3346806 RepID=UPI0036781A8B